MNKILRKIIDVFEPFLPRRIKDVDTWDGSPSLWDDTEGYCRDCLIDANDAADREVKVQSHCFLPIREPGDTGDTYVRQAAFAAAGGRGISQVEKPDDVSDDQWDSLVKRAADKLIEIYEDMDDVAPESVFEIAGREAPERAIPLAEFYTGVYSMLDESGMYPMDIYHDEDGMFAIATREGKMYKYPIIVMDDGVRLGEPEIVTMEFLPAEQRGFSVSRQADGQYRWVAIACTAILNRSGEIDTTTLFDKFVERLEDEGYPELDVAHIPGTDIGKADFVARDGYVLVVSGLFDDENIASAVAESVARDAGYWGTSIMYRPIEGDLIDIEGVKIPSYTDGVLRKVSVLPEASAAALFTVIETGGNEMNERNKEALIKLLGEELANDIENRADNINERAIDENMIAREEQQDQPQCNDCQCENTDNQRDQNLEDALVTEHDRVVDVIERLGNMEVGLEALTDALKTFVTDTTHRIAMLEREESDRKRAWLADLPQYKMKPTKQSWRPRDNAPTEDEKEMPAAQRAKMILERKGN